MHLKTMVMFSLNPFLPFAARVLPTLPKQERPAREGARVASVETGLAAAAAKLAHQVCVHHQVLI